MGRGQSPLGSARSDQLQRHRYDAGLVVRRTELLFGIGGSTVEAVAVLPANKSSHQAVGTYPDAYSSRSHDQAPYHQACQDPQFQLRRYFERGHAGPQRTGIALSRLRNRPQTHQYH